MIIIIIIINEFHRDHRDASLTKTLGPLMMSVLEFTTQYTYFSALR